MQKTRLCLLDCGTLALEGYKLFWGRGSAELIRFASYCVLVDHPDALFLFDTGFDIEFMEKWTPQDHALQNRDQTVLAQLTGLGIRPGDIEYIVQSHMHIDHVGSNKLFPDATIVVHEREYQAAKDPMPFEYQSYSDLSFDPELHRLNFIGDRDILHRAGTAEEVPPVSVSPKYEFLAADTEIFEGIWLYETPGHSLGQMSMVVDLAAREPVMFPADTCHTPRHLDEMIVPGFHVDPVAGYRSIARVKELQARHGAEIFFGHPPGDSLTYRSAPEWY